MEKEDGQTAKQQYLQGKNYKEMGGKSLKCFCTIVHKRLRESFWKIVTLTASKDRKDDDLFGILIKKVPKHKGKK